MKIPRSLGVLAPSAVLSLSISACGGNEPPPKEPENHEEPAPRERKPNLKMQSELGEIDQAKTQAVFRSLSPQFSECQDKRKGAVKGLGGDAKFFVRVGPDGKSKWAYLEDSTIGDLETEKCLLDAIAAAQFPKPDGGDAEVHYGVGLDVQGREPVDWPKDKVAGALAPIAECTSGQSGFRVTMYVADAGGSKGKVVATGVAVPNRDAVSKIDCIVEAAKDLKVPSPGGWPAKVSVSF
jgi:hypothetical protein